MPFEKGKSGNPGGRVRDRAFTDMLRVALNETDSKGVKKLRLIADKLVASAVAGNPFAIQQIADRLEGKPMQAIEATLTDERDVSDLSGAELLAATNRALKALESGNRGTGAGEDGSSDLRQLN
jgi:hypothetical protein